MTLLGLAPLLFACAAPTLPFADPLGLARDALDRGQLEAVKAAIPGVDDDAKALRAPGLLGRALEAAGQRDAACALYETDSARSPDRAPAALLHHARCISAGPVEPAKAAWAKVMATALGKEPLVLDEAARFLARAPGEPPDLVRDALRVDVPPDDTDRREGLARGCALLVERGGPALRDKALRRLYQELPETDAAKAVLATPAGAALMKHDDVAAALARAEVLTNRHDSDAVLETLAKIGVKNDDDTEAACTARFQRGKAQRKLHKYAAARRELDLAGARCKSDAGKRALYLAARVGAIQKGEAGTTALRAFIERYPDDNMTDDILLWLADRAVSNGALEEAEKLYADQIARFPTGDMVHEARFKLAFVRARRGNVVDARRLLDDAAQALSADQTASAPELVDRARYWSARLALAPSLESLTLATDEALRREGLSGLQALAVSRPASYYGQLARTFARRVVANDATAKAAFEASLASSTPQARSAMPADAALPLGVLADNAAFRQARALVEAGYDVEGAWLLDGISKASLGTPERTALAALYLQAGAPAQAQVALREGGLAALPGFPQGDSLLGWALAYPRAHDGAITKGAADAKIAPQILFGLAREESTFDAAIVSWAGAVGLTQLMPATARDEARALSLPEPTVNDLRAAALNARLGGSHLARRLRDMRHPLLGICAYNAGPGMVSAWRKGRPRPVDAFVELIPVDETRGYVKRVTASWVTYSALDASIDDVRFPLELP